MNKTLEDHFSKFVQWDHYLPFMMMALCSATNESTKCTPAMQQLEWELRLPVDLLIGYAKEPTSARNYDERLLQESEEVHNFAQNNPRLSSDQMKSHYDIRADDKTFQAGDVVWLYNPRRKPGLTPKIMRPWEGPMLSPRLLMTSFIPFSSPLGRSPEWPTITIFGSMLDWSHRPGSRLQTPRFPSPYLVNSKEFLLHLLKSSTFSLATALLHLFKS